MFYLFRNFLRLPFVTSEAMSAQMCIGGTNEKRVPEEKEPFFRQNNWDCAFEFRELESNLQKCLSTH